MDGIVLLRDELDYLRRIALAPLSVPEAHTISEELIVEHLVQLGLVEPHGEEFRATPLGLVVARQPLEPRRRPVVHIRVPPGALSAAPPPPHFLSHPVPDAARPSTPSVPLDRGGRGTMGLR